MAYYLGNFGKVSLKRKSAKAFASSVSPDDVNVSLSRFGIEEAVENLITGDRIHITTDDARGLDFLPTSVWADGGGSTQKDFTAFCNVNALGGVRLFNSFANAVNNVRANEYPVEAFSGAAIPVDISVLGSSERTLGDVAAFTFNTDREALDTTTMSDRFKKMFTAGLISGAGSLDCIFNEKNNGVDELSLLMLQLIQRTEIGSEFSCYLRLTNTAKQTGAKDVYYTFDAMVTRTGVDVKSGAEITCAIDFVTTGEIRLVVGEPAGFKLLTQAGDSILLQQNLEAMFSNLTD